MTLATKADITKRKKKLDTWLKGLNEDGSMSEKKLCALLRSSAKKDLQHNESYPKGKLLKCPLTFQEPNLVIYG